MDFPSEDLFAEANPTATHYAFMNGDAVPVKLTFPTFTIEDMNAPSCSCCDGKVFDLAPVTNGFCLKCRECSAWFGLIPLHSTPSKEA